MCVINKSCVYVCVLVKIERETTVNHKPKHCVHSGVHLMEKCGTAPKQYLTERSFIEILTSNLELV